MSPTELRGAFDGPIVQEMWSGRFCDVCRAKDIRPPNLANHARDSFGGGREFYCDDHLPDEEA